MPSEWIRDASGRLIGKREIDAQGRSLFRRADGSMVGRWDYQGTTDMSGGRISGQHVTPPGLWETTQSSRGSRRVTSGNPAANLPFSPNPLGDAGLHSGSAGYDAYTPRTNESTDGSGGFVALALLVTGFVLLTAIAETLHFWAWLHGDRCAFYQPFSIAYPGGMVGWFCRPFPFPQFGTVAFFALPVMLVVSLWRLLPPVCSFLGYLTVLSVRGLWKALLAVCSALGDITVLFAMGLWKALRAGFLGLSYIIVNRFSSGGVKRYFG